MAACHGESRATRRRKRRWEALPGSPAEAYLASRGIPLAVAQAARVGYDAGGALGQKMRGHLVFPLATIDGELVNAMAA